MLIEASFSTTLFYCCMFHWTYALMDESPSRLDATETQKEMTHPALKSFIK